MKAIRWFMGLAAVVAVAGLIAGPVGATEEAAKKDEAAGMEAMMAEYTTLAAPNEHHAHLKNLVGSWKAETKFWAQPGAQPEVSTGKAQFEMVLGGRFLKTSYTGEFMGNSFEGIGYSGFDRLQGKHIDFWMDTMGTSVMKSEGHCEEDGKIVKLAGQIQDPTGKTMTMKTVSRVVSDNTIVFEMYGPDTTGKEFKTMEITYTR